MPATNAEAIQVAGKSNIWLALPATPTMLIKVGEQLDDTQLEILDFWHDVHADSHGGPQGPPVERQHLGKIARGTLTLSKWNPLVLEHLHKHNLMATEGTLLETEIGGLTLKDRHFRVLIYPKRTNVTLGAATDYHLTWNFPCAVLGSPVQLGQGTKFSALRLSVEAHRAPAGHAKAGVVWDRDVTADVSVDVTA